MKVRLTGDFPETFYALVEISEGSRNKYEYHEDVKSIVLDRILFTPMNYPTNYGMILGTRAKDGDPLDVLIISSSPIQPGILVKCRPIGIAEMHDEEGEDNKIIAVPVDNVDPNSSTIREIGDIPENFKNIIRHFFEHYKELEENKFMKFGRFGSRNDAIREIKASMISEVL
ncbi:MAG: inorganic diphosphatase [Thermoplasmatales archaeon]